MRGTLHFVPAMDARWMLETLAPRVMKAAAGRHRRLELDEVVFRRSRTIITRALAREPIMTRAALNDALRTGGIAPDGQRGIHILQQLCMERMLCQGPHAGRQPTFVLFDEWIRKSRTVDREDALKTLAERYFVSHGPARLRDFAGWTGLPMADAKVALHLAKPALGSITGDDGILWMSADRPTRTKAVSRAHLLPGFDELLLGYKDRSISLAPEYASRIFPGGGTFRPTLVLDGRVCGTWGRSMRGKSVLLAASPFVGLKASHMKAFAAPVARYEQFLGMPVTLKWMEWTTRA